MKYLIPALLLLLVFIACSTPLEDQTSPPVIPRPNSLDIDKGSFPIGREISASINDPQMEAPVILFARQMEEEMDVILSDKKDASVHLEILPNGEKEAYELKIKRKEILLQAGSVHGIFNGLQTLRQLFLFAEEKGVQKILPRLKIQDAPRFGWRGIMLDESRHFFGKEKVKEILDLMALHKLNVFHWHLTDVPGWRIEIKKYPRLTEIGGIGNHTDPEAPAQYYTQEEIREIVDYAASRFIEIVPEIDMPGHATAANRAYPEFSGGGSERYPEFTFNPGKEGTYAFLTDILREVTGLFPSEYIHLGGDEVHFGNENWNHDPAVQNLIKEHQLADLREVEQYFVQRMADSIRILNKTVIGWDEIVDHQLPSGHSVVMWWRHDKPGQLKKALEKGYPVVLCPRIPLYFDFVQHESHQDGRRWGSAFSPAELVYTFPPDSLPGFQKYQQQVKGLQANVWTERIHNNPRLDFMLHPRLSTLAEAAWTKPAQKDFNNFKERLVPMIHFLDNNGVGYFDPIHPESTPEIPAP